MSENAQIRHDMYPLSQSQTNIWRIEQRFSGLPLNNICCVLNVAGNPDEALLALALKRALEQAPILRARLTLVDGEPRQYRSNEPFEEPRLYDLSESDEALERWADAMAGTYMPLYDAPLVRAALFRRSSRACGVLLCMHHLVSDAGTAGLMMRAVAENYQSLLAGGTADAADMPDYFSFIKEETEYLLSPRHEKDEAFWREQVAQISTADTFGGELPAAKRLSVLLSNATARRAELFCERERLSPFLLFAAAMFIYRMRVMGEEAPVIGVPVTGRRTAQEKRAPGMFVRTLPFVVRTDGRQTFSDFIETVNERWYDLLKHERFPYAQIEKLAGNRRLFDFALSFQPGVTALMGGARASFEGKWYFSGCQAQRLCLHISADGEHTRLDADYQTQVYDEKKADALVRALLRLLADGLENPDKPLNELRMLSEEEEDRLLSDAGEARTPILPAPKALLREVAGQYPARAALIFQGERVTYRALLDRAEKWGETITANTPFSGAALSIECTRGIETFVGLCAALLSDTPFLLPDQKQPPERLEAIRRKARVGLILTDQGLVRAGSAPSDTLKGARPAYYIATSGSTGEPKLVATPEAALANLCRQMAHFYGRGAVLSLCNTAFDAFLIESVCALLNARTIVIAQEAEMNDPEALARLMRAYDASFLSMTPSRMSAYLTCPAFREALFHAESLVLGGERFPADLLTALKKATDARIYNQYGPSEAAVCVSAARLDSAEHITCGKPLGGCRVYVLDEALHPMPPRALGEILIAGVCLSLGYQGDEEATRRAFVRTAFEARLFKTGDMGYMTEDGELVCVGRRDGQIKLNGRRVELGEIEACMRRMPGVLNACVTRGASGLVAYLAADRLMDEDAARAFALSVLPRYMAPDGYVFLKTLPMTPNGKVDLRALPPYVRQGGGEPANELERAALCVLRDALNDSALGASDDFFRSGGDSLNALKALACFKERFGRPLTLAQFAAHPSARALAKLLGGEAACPKEEAAFPRAKERREYPLSPAQRRFYTLMLLDGGVGYNMAGAYRASLPLDRERLERAFRQLVALDEQFRVRFVQKGAEVFAIYEDDVPFSLEDARGDTIEAAFSAFVRPFDVTRAPLMRAAVYHDASGDVLFVDMPHIVSDGMSGPLLMARLDALYRGETPAMPGTRYRDYACALEKRQTDEKTLACWGEMLSALPPKAEPPFDYPDGAPLGARLDFPLPKEAAEAVLALSVSLRATAFDVLCAAYMQLLSFLSGADDLCVGVPVSGRTDERLAEVTGPFVNTLPLRARFSGTCAEAVRAVAAARQMMLDHMDISPADLARLAGRTDGEPLYAALFSLLPASPAHFSLGDIDLSLLNVGRPPLKAKLTLEAVREGDCFALSLIYDAARCDETTIAFYARAYAALLQYFARCPNEKPAPLCALDASDRSRLIDRPRRRVTPCDLTTLYERIEENALLTPAAVAVVTLSGGITYQELVHRARAMNALLRREGVAQGSAVGVMLKRDADLLPALLGVWAAGCAYVPMDESFPKERIERMAERADVSLILVSDERAGEGLSRRTVKARFDLPEEPALPIDPEDAAYVLFTSGSTGEPKGVSVPHRALSNLMLEADALIGSCCTILCATNAIFDVFVTETWLPLALGRAVVMADERQMLLPSHMAGLIAGTHADLVQLTPSRMRLCLSAAAFKANLSNVKRVLLIGEALTLSLKNAIAACTKARIINQYGPTEATVLCAYRDVTQDERRIPIGKPDANCRFYALDQAGRPVLPTAAGELYIAGACLAKGYVGRDDLTEKAFLPDPFVKGQRMYKTGDLVRLLPSGDWTYLDRLDGQIKLNGHRIELGEIESAALDSALVAEAAAVAIIRDGQAEAIRLFVVAPENSDITALADRMRERLPAYMMPGRIERLPALPRTPSGKTDKKALAALPYAQPQAETKKQAGADDWLRALWREALKTEALNETDNFFALGGTSLTALLVLNGYFERGLRMTLEQFYQAPTLRAQRAMLGLTMAEGDTASAPKTQAAAPALSLPREMPLEKGSGKKDGDVLLTGASGFLGAHVLRELILSGRHVICLTRDEARLQHAVSYYFGDRLYGYETIVGDVTKPRFGLSFRQYAFLAMRTGLVVHSAADVRHYAADDAIERTNLGGTERVVNFCMDAEAALCHVSTASICGRHAPEPVVFTERDLYLGQDGTGNAYIRSKLEAEALVARAMGEGLTAQIMRVGRLVSRQTDGCFQLNAEKNLFYRLITAARALGALPEGAMNLTLDMTPVDACAAALVALLPEKEAVYHLVPPRLFSLREISRALHLNTLPNDRFERLLLDALRRAPSPALSSLGELAMNAGAEANVTLSVERTAAALARTGFIWPEMQLQTLLKGLCEK